MTPFRIHILGCGSALPTLRHNPSSQIVEIRDKFFMIDCGEGTQVALRRVHVHFNKIQGVFISHLHGDHCLGLVGMISTFGLLGRTAPLHIYAPKELGQMLPQQLEFFCKDLDYDVVIHDVDTEKQQVIYDDRSLTVETIPLQHRIPCCGYLFREKEGKRHILREMTDFYEVPISQFENIRAGMDWTTNDGEIVKNEKLTRPADPARSYAYCSDTRYIPELCNIISGVTMLYHESTYCDDREDRAVLYYHSTARQAAKVAKDAGAGTLLLGHFSQRYTDEKQFLTEAREVFDNSHLTSEGKVFIVK